MTIRVKSCCSCQPACECKTKLSNCPILLNHFPNGVQFEGDARTLFDTEPLHVQPISKVFCPTIRIWLFVVDATIISKYRKLQIRMVVGKINRFDGRFIGLNREYQDVGHQLHVLNVPRKTIHEPRLTRI